MCSVGFIILDLDYFGLLSWIYYYYYFFIPRPMDNFHSSTVFRILFIWTYNVGMHIVCREVFEVFQMQQLSSV